MSNECVPFQVWFKNTFHARELYDRRGRQVHNLGSAAAVAEDLYGSAWREVANCHEGIHREDWIKLFVIDESSSAEPANGQLSDNDSTWDMDADMDATEFLP